MIKLIARFNGSLNGSKTTLIIYEQNSFLLEQQRYSNYELIVIKLISLLK